MDVKYKKLGKNTALVFLGGASSKIVNFVMLPLYTRWLSVSEYGLADIITVYATLLIGVVACCIYDAVFVLPKRDSVQSQTEYFSSAVGFVVFTSIVTAILFYIISKVSICAGLDGAFFSHIWLIYALLIPEIIFKILQQFCRCIDKMVVFSVSGIVVTLGTALLSFLFIPSYGVFGYITSMSLSYIFASVLVVYLCKTYRYFNLNMVLSNRLREMLTYSIPLIPNALMWWLVDALNRPMMEKIVGLSGIGIYAVANKFPGLLSLINSSFMTSWQISVLDEFGKPNYNEFYNKIFRLTVVSLSIFLIVITLSSETLIRLFATQDYYSAWKLIPLLTLGVLFSNVSGFVGCNFSATKESKYYFYSSVWGAIIAIIFNIILIPFWGIWGAAITSLLSFIMMTLSRLYYSWKYARISSANLYLFLFVMDLLFIILVVSEINFIISMIIAMCLIIIHLYSVRNILKLSRVLRKS